MVLRRMASIGGRPSPATKEGACKILMADHNLWDPNKTGVAIAVKHSRKSE